jgi:uncharacterized protein YjbI with pentapeptide repeats
MTQPLAKGEIFYRLSKGESMRGLNMVRADLSAVDLARVDLTQANLRMANLLQANLSDARLTNAFLSGATLNQAQLVGANLVQASMIGAMLKGADLSRADLSGADLTGATLEGAQLSGAFLVGTFLTETDLSNADLSGAYVRMSQMGGSILVRATFESADLSHSDLSGAKLEAANLASANLTGTKLSACSLIECDLRYADLTNANLNGANLTGAKLYGIKYTGVSLADAWADWVDLSSEGKGLQRGTMEEAFVGILTRPMAQMLVEGVVTDDVWVAILSHLCEFRLHHPEAADVQLKAINRGLSSSALYLEADRETSLAAYFQEMVDIVGRGSQRLAEKLSVVNANQNGHKAVSADALYQAAYAISDIDFANLTTADDPLGLSVHEEMLQRTPFWNSEKAFVILTGTRQVYLEAASNDLLTLRPPHNAISKLDLINGHFVMEEARR